VKPLNRFQNCNNQYPKSITIIHSASDEFARTIIEKSMSSTTKSAIAHWLANGDTVFQALLSQCNFYPHPSGELTIDCPGELLDQVLDACRALAQPAIRLQIPQLSVSSEGEIICRFQPDLAYHYPPTTLDRNIPLIWQLPDPTDEIAIVRMSDHRALYTTAALDKGSKAASGWMGEDMSRWHIPEELQRLVTALDEHQFVETFQYRAFNYIREPVEIIVNAWLTAWKGQSVRVVQTLKRTAL
jgi:hypothetical protein